MPAGQRIKLVVHNQDATPEEFESHSLNREKVIPGGAKATIYIGPLKPGRYTFSATDKFGREFGTCGRDVVVEACAAPAPPPPPPPPPATSCGRLLKLSGAGIEDRQGQRGDHLAEIVVTVPPDLTDTERELLRQIESGRREAVGN